MTENKLSVEAGNKIIAEFMGGIFGDVVNGPFSDYKAFHFEPNNNPNPHANCGTYKRLNDLEYHLRWEWLMPVVEKIEALHHIFEHHYINVRISQGYIEIEGTKTKIFKNTSIEGSKIKALWLAVIEFITWYQNQSTLTK